MGAVRVATYKIVIGGKTYDREKIASFQVTSDLNKPDEAKVRLSNLHAEDRDKCKPGKDLTIEVGYDDGKNKGKIFEGKISAGMPHFDVGGAWTIEVTAYDKSYEMKRQPRSETYQEMTIQQMVQKVVSRTPSLSPDFGKEPPSGSEYKWNHMQQANKTDYDFLLYLALLSNRVVFCRESKLYFVRREKDKAPEVTLKYGVTGENSLQSLRSDQSRSVEGHIKSVTVAAWDYTASDDSGQSVRGKATSAGSKLGSNDVDGGSDLHFILPVRNTAQAKIAAQSLLETQQFERGTAECVADGNAKIKVGDVIKLEVDGSSKDDGNYYLSRVVHKYSHEPGLGSLLGDEVINGYCTIFEGKRDADIGTG